MCGSKQTSRSFRSTAVAALFAVCGLMSSASAIGRIEAREHVQVAQLQNILRRSRQRQSGATLSGADVELSVGRNEEVLAGSLARVLVDGGAVLEATRAAGIPDKNDALRLASLGRVGQVVVQDPSDSTVLLTIPGVGEVWFPVQALLRRRRQGEVSFAGHGHAFKADPVDDQGRPRYPIDPLLDIDYIYDDNQGKANYLEDYANTSEITRRLLRRYNPTTMTVASTTPTTTTTTATIWLASEPEPASTTHAPLPSSPAELVVAGCTTHLDPRLERGMLQKAATRAKPASAGTPCIFGLSDKDEGSHCVFDSGQYGSSGWCYTKADRSEWGSCSQGCPLEGSAKKLGGRIDHLTQEVYFALALVNGK